MGKGELEQLDSGPRHQYGLHTRDNPPGIERRNPNLEVFQQPGNRLAALFLSAATFSPSDVPKVFKLLTITVCTSDHQAAYRDAA